MQLKNPPGRFIYFCALPIDSNQVPQSLEFNALFIRNGRILRYKVYEARGCVWE